MNLQRQLPWRAAHSDHPLRFPLGNPDEGVLLMLPPYFETIPVRSIIGTVSRSEQLDSRFRPMTGRSHRLTGIKRAMQAGVSLPPIELYRLDGAYYIIDGHHRVAAANDLGQLYLDAMVIECRRRNEECEDPLDAARISFALSTGLRSIAFSSPAGYEQALEQIYEHRWYLCERGRMVSLKDAADHWHRTIYLPVASQIATQGLSTTEDPTHTGDAYLRLSDLKYMVSQERGHDIGFATAIREWAGKKRRQPGLALRRLLRGPFAAA
jgi:uncharacterized ParB-like nuclease family protein